MIKNWAKLARLPGIFSAFSNILAGYIIAFVFGGDSIQWGALIVISLASGCLYLSGMILNDCFDYDEDSRDRPERPLPAGIISRGKAWSVGAGLLILGPVLAFLVSENTGYVASFLAIAIIVYNGFAKQHFYGCFVMGACRYLNWILGMSIVGLSFNLFVIALPIFLYICSLTWLSRQETIASDRFTVVISGLGLSISLISIFGFSFIFGEPGIKALLFIPLAYFFGKRLLETYGTYTPESIQKTIQFLLVAIIPIDAVVVVLYGEWWLACMLLLLVIPSKIMVKKLYLT